MPKEIKDLKVFLSLFQGSKASEKNKKNLDKEERIHPRTQFKKKLMTKKNKNITKFKLRTSKYLYTFKTSQTGVIKKIMGSVPSEVVKVDLDKAKSKKK